MANHLFPFSEKEDERVVIVVMFGDGDVWGQGVSRTNFWQVHVDINTWSPVGWR